MQSMVSAGGGGGDGKSADDAGFLLWNFVWTYELCMPLTSSWAAPGRDAILKVMDATAASIQDKLPKPFAHLWHGYCIHNSTQKNIQSWDQNLWSVRLDVCELKFPTQYEDTNLCRNSELSFNVLHTRKVFPSNNCLNNWASCQPTLYPPLLNPFATSLLTLLKTSSTNGFLSARVLERFETFLLNLLASIDFLPAPLFEASAYLISLVLLFVSAFSSSAAANRLLLPFVSRVCCAIRIHLWLPTISALFHQSVVLAQKTQWNSCHSCFIMFPLVSLGHFGFLAKESMNTVVKQECLRSSLSSNNFVK